MRVLLFAGSSRPFLQTPPRPHGEGWDLIAGRVCFTRATVFLRVNGKLISFSGDLHAWSNWLRARLARGTCDIVVGYGCFRPAMSWRGRLQLNSADPSSALRRAICVRLCHCRVWRKQHGIAAGRRLPPPGFASESGQAGPNRFHAFAQTCRYGAAYYLLRSLLSRKSERGLYHRKIRSTREPFFLGAQCLPLLAAKNCRLPDNLATA